MRGHVLERIHAEILDNAQLRVWDQQFLRDVQLILFFLLLPCTFMQDGRKVSRWILGDYDDDFVRRDGRWMFSRLDVIFNFNVAQGDSWAGMEQVRAG